MLRVSFDPDAISQSSGIAINMSSESLVASGIISPIPDAMHGVSKIVI